MSSSSSTAVARRADSLTLMRQSEERRQRIESGQEAFSGKTVHVDFICARIYCNKCNVIGDNLRVVGDGNRLYGTNNRANGIGNKMRTLAEWQQKILAAGAAYSSTVLTSVRGTGSVAAVDVVTMQRPNGGSVSTPLPVIVSGPPSKQPQASLMPEAGQDPRNSPWKRMVADLTGSVTPCTIEELQCIVCFENRFDVIFEPCHHQCVCIDCAKALVVPRGADLPLCPLCRRPIELSTVVYSK